MSPDARVPRASRRYIPLFWRLFIPNASVLVAACIVLWAEPANGRIVALVGGLTVMLIANVILLRRTFTPLTRLTSLMHAVDPLRPGSRIPPLGPESEVTVLARAFNAMLERVETERRESARRALLDQENERRHLAAELHDEIGQALTALILQLDRHGARDGLAIARTTAAQTIEDVRRLVRRLRPEVLDQLGLTPALTNLCVRLSARTGLHIRRDFPASLPSLVPEAELVIYRVVQESLTNVVRHAHAHEATVRLHGDDEVVELVVSDDGVGLPSQLHAGDGQGIRGMRERAVAIGAELTMTSPSGGGAEVRLRVPLPAPVA